MSRRYDASMAHHFTCRVYYEDTDLAGVVYYANYLKFIERARSEYVRSKGLDQSALRASGLVFVVTRIEADYLKPARFEDELTVLTAPVNASRVRLVLSQDVLRGDTTLFRAKITLAAMSLEGRPLRLPAVLTSPQDKTPGFRR
jgi:acyl-CoA thioester hydrolase